MRARGIHHVGVAVEDLDAAVDMYTRYFGASVEHRGMLPDQGVESAAILIGSDRIELVSSLGEDTPVGRFLAKRGPGMHHVAYEVEDVQESLTSLEREGAQLIDAEPKTGLFGLQVAFVHPHSVHGVLSEVVGSP